MHKQVKIYIIYLLSLLVGLCFFGSTFAADLLDTAFQPSKNLQHVINIGNTKNAVGNEVFRGSTNIDDVEGDLLFKRCYQKKPETTRQNCEANKGFWQEPGVSGVPGGQILGSIMDSNEGYGSGCYNPVQAKLKKIKKEEREAECKAKGTSYEYVKLAGITTSQNPSLIVRVTKTLLRLTIILAIPMIIFIAVKILLGIVSGNSDYKDDIKNVALILGGLVLALSAIGIIYLIQSITTTQSLPITP